MELSLHRQSEWTERQVRLRLRMQVSTLPSHLPDRLLAEVPTAPAAVPTVRVDLTVPDSTGTMTAEAAAQHVTVAAEPEDVRTAAEPENGKPRRRA